MKKLLVVVDMQKDFIDGSLGTAEAESIVPAVSARIDEYRRDGQSVVFTLDTHGEDYMDTQEGRNLPVMHCIKGTEGWKIDGRLDTDGSVIFEKPSFGSLELAAWIKERDFDEIELAGLCTDICVISNAMIIKAAVPETPIVVDARCCAGVTPRSHANALSAMQMCQIKVVGC